MLLQQVVPADPVGMIKLPHLARRHFRRRRPVWPAPASTDTGQLQHRFWQEHAADLVSFRLTRSTAQFAPRVTVLLAVIKFVNAAREVLRSAPHAQWPEARSRTWIRDARPRRVPGTSATRWVKLFDQRQCRPVARAIDRRRPQHDPGAYRRKLLHRLFARRLLAA